MWMHIIYCAITAGDENFLNIIYIETWKKNSKKNGYGIKVVFYCDFIFKF